MLVLIIGDNNLQVSGTNYVSTNNFNLKLICLLIGMANRYIIADIYKR